MRTLRLASAVLASVSLAGAALVGLAVGPAMAIDPSLLRMPYRTPPPVASWTGCYVGATLGGVWGKSDVTWAPNPPGFTLGGVLTAGAARTTLSSSGFSGGGEVGCNYQMSSWLVLGVEGDFESAALGTTRTAGGAGGVSPFTESFGSHWLSTIRGRAGVAVGQWLFFASGGAAFANLSLTDQIFFAGSSNMGAFNGTVTGWTVGGGVEWAVTPRWTVKGEYLYVDLGNTSYTSPNSNPANVLSTILHSHNVTESIGRFGLNYRL
jgi:outer membrane immunogenic protein